MPDFFSLVFHEFDILADMNAGSLLYKVLRVCPSIIRIPFGYGFLFLASVCACTCACICMRACVGNTANKELIILPTFFSNTTCQDAMYMLTYDDEQTDGLLIECYNQTDHPPLGRVYVPLRAICDAHTTLGDEKSNTGMLCLHRWLRLQPPSLVQDLDNKVISNLHTGHFSFSSQSYLSYVQSKVFGSLNIRLALEPHPTADSMVQQSSSNQSIFWYFFSFAFFTYESSSSQSYHCFYKISSARLNILSRLPAARPAQKVSRFFITILPSNFSISSMFPWESDPISVVQSFKIFVGTWNLGNAPPPDDLSPWIPVDKHSN